MNSRPSAGSDTPGAGDPGLKDSDMRAESPTQPMEAVETARETGCRGLAWDHPLSRADISRRVTIQCNRLREFAGQQVLESARASAAAREVARVHAAAADAAAASRVRALEKQCEEAHREAASARQEVIWLKKMMEAMVGLEAGLPGSPAARYAQNAKKRLARAISVPSGARLQLYQDIQNGGTGLGRATSPQGRSPGTGTGSSPGVKTSGTSEANHRTVMRRIRRRNCRQRYLAMERAANDDTSPQAPEANLGTPTSTEVSHTPNPNSASVGAGSTPSHGTPATPRCSGAGNTAQGSGVHMAVPMPASWFAAQSSSTSAAPQNHTQPVTISRSPSEPVEHFTMFTVRDDLLPIREQPSAAASAAPKHMR